MKLLSTYRAWAILGAMVLVMALTGGVANATNSWTNSSGDVYHWASTVSPLSLSLGDNVSGSWDAHLAVANSDWNLSGKLNNAVDPGRTNPRKCSPSSGLVEICNAKYGFNGWLGVAGIWASGDHITKVYVKVNDSYFNTSTYNTPAWRQLLMCQEIGHIFGLGHQDENFNNGNLGTCMDYTSSPDSNQHPDQHDYAQLDLIYGHLDNFNSWAPAPVADDGGGNGNGKGQKGNAPGLVISEWGKAISADGKGRPDIFEVDLGNGNKVFTHVFWAD